MMTTAEKARQLVDKMGGFTLDDAKSNAKVSVDEIILSCPSEPFDGYWETFSDKVSGCIQYWEEVKSEIEKLQL